MRVLFDHPSPFLLAHGGFQVQIEQTKTALTGIGVDVDWLRWWDDAQPADIIHYFGRPPALYVDQCRHKGIRLVFSALHGGLGSRKPSLRYLQKIVTRTAEWSLPPMITDKFGWRVYRECDACVVLTTWEKHLVQQIFRAPADRVSIIPNGVEAEFFAAPELARGPWLLTVASILPVKRIVETASAAVNARTPLWVVGRPFSESDAYYREFLNLVAKHPEYLRYEGAITNRTELARAYAQARGFVLLSHWETLSIAALEAAACRCPLLLGDLPWAHATFATGASFCPRPDDPKAVSRTLRWFYDNAPALPLPPVPGKWSDVADSLRALYTRISSKGTMNP